MQSINISINRVSACTRKLLKCAPPFSTKLEQTTRCFPPPCIAPLTLPDSVRRSRVPVAGLHRSGEFAARALPTTPAIALELASPSANASAQFPRSSPCDRLLSLERLQRARPRFKSPIGRPICESYSPLTRLAGPPNSFVLVVRPICRRTSGSAETLPAASDRRRGDRDGSSRTRAGAARVNRMGGSSPPQLSRTSRAVVVFCSSSSSSVVVLVSCLLFDRLFVWSEGAARAERRTTRARRALRA